MGGSGVQLRRDVPLRGTIRYDTEQNITINDVFNAMQCIYNI